MNFPEFQFLVDNASSIERSVSILLSQYLQHPDWILQYLHETPHPIMQHQLLIAFLRDYTDYGFFRELLLTTNISVDRWLLKAVCDTDDPLYLEVLLELPVVVDDWICFYVYNHPDLTEWGSLYQQLLAYQTDERSCIQNTQGEG